MIILGIESSCDDTSVALVEATEQGFTVLSEKTASQIEVHKKYGGVVPEIAGRMHAEQILPVIEAVISEYNLSIFSAKGGPALGWQSSNLSQFKPDVIAVTAGPGLVTGLVVGVEAAKALSYLWNVPLVAVNHIEGHMLSVLIDDQTTDYRLQTTRNTEMRSESRSLKSIIFPALALVVSGGHTELILMADFGKYKIIGKTLDDAAGECFDKVAKLLGLEYPGGPKISKLALEGRTDAIPFPRPMIDSKDYNFSFAGLKTSALYYLRDHPIPYTLYPTPLLSDFCASFEQAIIDVLVSKTLSAGKKYHPKTVLLGGGVSANKKLRNALETELREFPNSPISLFPPPRYSMDNGAMIAVAGYFHAKKNRFISWKDITANPNWKVDQI